MHISEINCRKHLSLIQSAQDRNAPRKYVIFGSWLLLAVFTGTSRHDNCILRIWSCCFVACIVYISLLSNIPSENMAATIKTSISWASIGPTNQIVTKWLGSTNQVQASVIHRVCVITVKLSYNTDVVQTNFFSENFAMLYFSFFTIFRNQTWQFYSFLVAFSSCAERLR